MIGRKLGKVRTIATFEFLTAVKRPGYLIATFGMPLFVLAYGAVVAIPAYFAAQKDKENTVYGVVDTGRVLALEGDIAAPAIEISDDVRETLESMGQGAALDQALAKSNFIFRPFENETRARSALVGEDTEGHFVLAEDYMATGRVDVYSPETVSFSRSDARDAFANLVRERLANGRVDPSLAARLVSPVRDPRRFSITRNGDVTDGSQAASAVRLAIPLVFIVLFLLSVLMTAGYLMQGTATEKENKVVDVLLASANPDEILAGKLLGLGGAGLLQIAVWLIMALATGIGVVPLLLTSGIEIPWLAVALAVPLFLIAFLFFGSLMLGTGSLGSNMREAQQLAMVWSLTAALPLMMMSVLIREPHGLAARVLTWIPFSSGSVIMLRASMDPGSLAWWEIAGSMLVLLASTWLAIKLGARLFRVGLLSSGARPSFREIIRQAQLGS
jgi:ABC-2 type transport system permease protein